MQDNKLYMINYSVLVNTLILRDYYANHSANNNLFYYITKSPLFSLNKEAL